MDAGDLFILLIILAQIWNRLLKPIWEKLQEAKLGQEWEASQGGRASPSAAPTPPTAAPTIPSSAEQEAVARVRENIQAAIDRAEQLIDDGEGLAQELTSRGPGNEHIAHAIEQPTLSELRRNTHRLREVNELLGSAEHGAGVTFLRNDRSLGESFDALQLAAGRIGLLREIAAPRLDPRRALVMADADAVAEAMLQPIRAFAAAHGMEFPDQHPICTPAQPDQEAVIYALFPGHPVIFVPPSFGEHMLRWVSVAHEVGHILWQTVPDLSTAMRELHPDQGTPWLPHQQGERITFDFSAAFGVWLEELTCDVIGVLMLGPAAVEGFIHAFAAKDDPVRTQVAPTSWSDERQLDEHPPAVLRLEISCWMLERMGYIAEAKDLHEHWHRLHPDATEVVLPTLDGKHIGVGLDQFMDTASAIFEEFYSETFPAMAGLPLTAISGFELSPGMWARAKGRASDLLDQTPFEDKPRIVVTAGMHAGWRRKGATSTIAEGVRAAIVGVGQRHRADPHFARHEDVEPIGLPLVRDALILGELLRRPGAKLGRVRSRPGMRRRGF